jgi:hypothetical protein
VLDLWARGRSPRAGVRPDAVARLRQNCSATLIPEKTSGATLTEDMRMLSGVRRQEGSAMRQGGSLRIADSMA